MILMDMMGFEEDEAGPKETTLCEPTIGMSSFGFKGGDTFGEFVF